MKRTTIKYIKPIILLLSTHIVVFPQQNTASVNIQVSLEQYIAGIAKGNLSYIAEQFNVSIAEAELKAARAFPDPEVLIAYANNEDETLQMGQGIETAISYPINLGNKRGAAIALAKSELALNQTMLDAYFHNLKADATLSYFSALKEKQLYQLQVDTYQRLRELAVADSIRFRAGEITEIDAMQSALEAKAQLGQVFLSRSAMQNMFLNLSVLQGKTLSDTVFIPSDDFPDTKQGFILEELIQSALKNRPDLQIAHKNKDISENVIRLLKANRAFEFNIEAGYSYNSIVKNEIAPAPAHNSYSAGLTIPLKFSNLNKGDLQAAKYAKSQSETAYDITELQIISEVLQAYHNYKAREEQVENFRQGLVAHAEKILKGRTYLYQRGESGLVDVLNAQRTFNDLKQEYYESLYEYTAAIVEMKRAAAIQ